MLSIIAYTAILGGLWLVVHFNPPGFVDLVSVM
jgi:hypothetical protein